MKTFLIAILSLSFTVSALAQQDSNKAGAMGISKENSQLGFIPKLSPLILFGIFQNPVNFDISIEKELLLHESVQLSYEYLYSKTILNPNTSEKTKGYLSILNPEFRYYFNKKHNHSSFFIGSDLEYILSESPYNSFPYETKFAAGINFGGRFIYKRIVLEFLFDYNTNFPVVFTNNPTVSDNGFFRFELNIGYRF